MIDGDDSIVAGDESDAVSASVAPSQLASKPKVLGEWSFTLVLVAVRGGVDPHSVACKPRADKLGWAAAKGGVTRNSMSRTVNKALPTGLSSSSF